MPFSVAARNTMLGALSPAYVSLHTANPGDNGANEVSGGSYARVAATWAAASSASRAASNQPAINVPAGTTVTYIGYWTASTGGTFLGYDDVTAASFTNAGVYTVNTATLSLS